MSLVCGLWFGLVGLVLERWFFLGFLVSFFLGGFLWVLWFSLGAFRGVSRV